LLRKQSLCCSALETERNTKRNKKDTSTALKNSQTVLRQFQSSYAICHQAVASFGVCGETVQYGHGRATTHGFRAVASTILNETNLFNRDWIERQLSHVERNEVRRAYNAAEWMPDRRRMMQWWADHITALALEGDKIIPLSRAGQLNALSSEGEGHTFESCRVRHRSRWQAGQLFPQ
jgi:hypothetical protein